MSVWFSRLLPAQLRAGAYGTWAGGDPGAPEVGVAVPVQNGAELEAVLGVLKEAGANITLLVPTAVARLRPDALYAATQAGHEIAGTDQPGQLSTLEVAASQPIQGWDTGGLDRTNLRLLASQGVHPLPFPLAAPQPGQTVRLLPAELALKLPEMRALGYRPVPVRGIPGLRQAGPRDLLLHVYVNTVEANFAREHGVIDLAVRADAVMRVAPLDHAPQPLPLPRGTPTAELHLHSPRLVGLAGRSGLGAYRAYLRGLKDVAAALQTRPELQDAQAVFAVTLFHGPLEKAGFALLPLPRARTFTYGLGFRVLRLVYGTARPPSDGKPHMAWMAREEFLAKYG
ncbi:YkoP family protein [Deinococcus arenicola]|uniref:Sectered polysaccharide deacetylase n=1 Tax=Deinococcus arenicola TaxID=2994950 RepID=A0ABU4DPG9_9DEIO|nr:Sectered polysaccharide deacetylase [Deinococcus sp. ZS9-10]MDV6374327.1 Sectered polysaccharide deacetylase [Deinococcus sp. ZS9-10]